MEAETKIAWQGPTGLGEGVTVVGSASAWETERARWPEILRGRVTTQPDFGREVAIVIAGIQTGELSILLKVGRLERDGDRVTLDVKAEPVATGVTVASAMNNPTLIVTAPADVFAGDPALTATWNGKTWNPPTQYRR
jgi:hypothetical protein